jgi:ricin-type beta-trefoil lectin protein/gametolysin peptidase M11
MQGFAIRSLVGNLSHFVLRGVPNPAPRLRGLILALLMQILVASAVSIGSPIAFAQGSSPGSQLDGPDMQRVLVIPVNLDGRAPVLVNREQIAQALYGAEDSVASRYRAISYGKVIFAGSDRDVVDPVTLSEPTDFCDAGLGRLADAAVDEVRRQGVVTPGDYNHFVFVLPKDAPCWWTGVGDIGGKRVWVKATTAKALQHELGHNLGMNHAVHWQSSDADGSDFMGSGGTGLNAPHVIEMGWLRDYPGRVIELTGAADVTLEALEADPGQSTLPKVASVRPAPGANTYYLSYRASSSANPLPDEFTRGLNIHVFGETRHGGGLTYFVASLSDGATYGDGPMIVRQLSHTEGKSVTFHIDFSGSGQAVPAGPPPAPLGTMQSLASGKCLDLPRGQSSDGTEAIQYDCHRGLNQQWSIEPGDAGYRIVSRMSGKCIGTDPKDASVGGHIVESQCGGSPAQLWTLEGGASNGYVLQNVANRLCMDVPRASLANGAEPIAWSCNRGTNQIWRYLSPGTL